jgi:hypothetical protein
MLTSAEASLELVEIGKILPVWTLRYKLFISDRRLVQEASIIL